MENSVLEIQKAINDNLYVAYEKAQKYLERLINLTPTGEERNKLCDQNIEIMMILNSLK